MKQTAWTKFLNWVLVTLGLAATSSCIPVMYGAPSMDYEISGKVVDEENNPIKGIRVVSPDRDTSFTDARGAFYISVERIGHHPYAKFEDIDGPENGGEFQDKIEDFKLEDLKKVEPGSGWYEGKYVGKDIVVKLEKKED